MSNSEDFFSNYFEEIEKAKEQHIQSNINIFKQQSEYKEDKKGETNHQKQCRESKKGLKELQKWWYKECRNEKRRIERKTNLKSGLNNRISSLIYNSLKGNKNGRHWEDIVGYTCKELIKRLEQTMPNGYTWQDYIEGKLHIDHIIPIRAFVFDKPEDKEFKDCWGLFNLRLLTKEENLFKKDSINPILLYLLITGGACTKGARLVCNQTVEGSIPFSSTNIVIRKEL